MITKNHCLFFNDVKQQKTLDNISGQYSSLNLNQSNKQCFFEETVSNSKNIALNESRKSGNCDLTDINDLQKRKDNSLSLWSNSSSSEHRNNLSSSELYKMKSEKQKEEKSLNKSNSNSSTLSLHISAYENSIEGFSSFATNNDDENVAAPKKKKSNKESGGLIKSLNGFSSAAIQNLFEFPRQQEETKNDESIKPEVMQFKASQKLLNPKQASPLCNNGQQDTDSMHVQALPQFHQFTAMSIFLPLSLFSRGRINLVSRNIRHQLFRPVTHRKQLLPYLIPFVHGTFTRSISTSSSSTFFSLPSSITSSSENDQKLVQSNLQQKPGPRKETLLTIDWILQGLTPQFMKTRLQAIFEKMDSEIDFIDEIFGYRVKGIDKLGIHITKIRAYFRWKSPYNKTAYKGSYLFEDENYIVLLWGLETMDSSLWTYFPSFITGKETPLRYFEGALHFTVSSEGKITKIVNRKISERDITLAKEFGDLKASENERFDKEDRKAAETEFLKDKIQFGEISSSSSAKIWSSKVVPTNLKQQQFRSFSTASDNTNNNMPEMYHLEHVQKRLEYTIPLMFRQRLDYTFYHRDIFYDNQILNMQDYGLDSYMKHLGRISVAGQLAMPYITMEPLSINLVREDGSVRVRWRIAYLSWLDSLNFKNFKAEYRQKNARWYDGNAAFYVGSDGLVYKVIIQKLTPPPIDDDSFTKKSTKKLVEKIGILPSNTTTTTATTNFVSSSNSKKKEI